MLQGGQYMMSKTEYQKLRNNLKTTAYNLRKIEKEKNWKIKFLALKKYKCAKCGHVSDKISHFVCLHKTGKQINLGDLSNFKQINNQIDLYNAVCLNCYSEINNKDNEKIHKLNKRKGEIELKLRNAGCLVYEGKASYRWGCGDEHESITIHIEDKDGHLDFVSYDNIS